MANNLTVGVPETVKNDLYRTCLKKSYLRNVPQLPLDLLFFTPILQEKACVQGICEAGGGGPHRVDNMAVDHVRMGFNP